MDIPAKVREKALSPGKKLRKEEGIERIGKGLMEA